MSYTVREYSPDLADQWNNLVKRSNNGTIFHRLDFLAYHGKRFIKDEKHLIIMKGLSIYSVMPMAIFEVEGQLIAKSPYGGSYGGPIFEKSQSYQAGHEVIDAILEYLQANEINKLTLTLPIDICHECYSNTFQLALLEKRFRCTNRDIVSVVDLRRKESIQEIMSQRGRRVVRKAKKVGVETTHKASLLDFWNVMEKNFAKHETSPTHTFEEFQWLADHFPEKIFADVAYIDNKPVAGIGVFIINKNVINSFYLCQDPAMRKYGALSLLIYESLKRAQQNQFKWFDLGTSSVNMKGRANIFQFKENFGSVGRFRETYDWSMA